MSVNVSIRLALLMQGTWRVALPKGIWGGLHGAGQILGHAFQGLPLPCPESPAKPIPSLDKPCQLSTAWRSVASMHSAAYTAQHTQGNTVKGGKDVFAWPEQNQADSP